jgi:two-component system sensor kinase FixL
MIASGKHTEQELSEILEDIVGADARAGQVIQHMRTLFRKGMPERRPLLLNTLINDVIALVGSDARLQNVAIDLDLAPGLPLVLGDRVQLQQVMLNLLVNAFDAMVVGSERPRRLIVRTCALEPSSVQLEVVDTGVGIAAEVLKTIFDPFVTTKVGGMGMGLSVSRSIVRAHEGEIYAENRPEGGAVFRVVLPAISVASETTSAPAP